LTTPIDGLRIRPLAQCQGDASIGNDTTRDGHDNASGIALDGNRMIWTWKLDLLSIHVSVSPFLLTRYSERPPMPRLGGRSVLWPAAASKLRTGMRSGSSTDDLHKCLVAKTMSAKRASGSISTPGTISFSIQHLWFWMANIR
jgi:hypothetical protein